MIGDVVAEFEKFVYRGKENLDVSGVIVYEV